MFAISIVTLNRADILARTLTAIHDTCPEAHQVHVTNNASTDSTGDLLREACRAGLVTSFVNLIENLGTSGGRNAHWEHCIGHDSVRMDDKVLPLTSGWLTAFKRQSEQHHAIIATPYDPTVMPLHRIAPCMEYVEWPQDQGRGGPLIFIPAGVTEQTGAIDELGDESTGERCKYGWCDCLQIERACLLGWHFGFSLRVPVAYLARANPARREGAMRWHPAYMERRRQYTEGERDVFVDVRETHGWAAARAAVSA